MTNKYDDGPSRVDPMMNLVYTHITTNTTTIKQAYGCSNPSIPPGWKATAFRLPLKGEAYLSSPDLAQVAQGDWESYPRLILEHLAHPRRFTILVEEDEDPQLVLNRATKSITEGIYLRLPPHLHEKPGVGEYARVRLLRVEKAL